MSNDLISRSALLEELNKNEIPFNAGVNHLIIHAPTAYDVDKVVEQLEEKSKDETCAGDGTMWADDAIEIVKAGGIE